MAADIGIRELAREAVLGFVFWSLFQALAPMIWFYPLNELEVTGYEAFAAVVFSPILLGPAWIRRLVQNRWVIALLRLGSVAGLASFQAPNTLTRLVTLSAGVFVVMMLLLLTLWHPSSKQRTLTCWGLVLGLLAFISSRVWFTTFVPTWWDFQTNSAVVTICTIATLDKIATADDSWPPDALKPARRPYWLPTACGFGSLLYLTQAVFGEVSLITRWTGKGYPETGPTPYPWGLAVLGALWLGVELSPCRHVVDNFLWWLIGAGSLAALYLLDTWQAFAGGLVLAVFTASIWPGMLDRVTACPPGRTMFVAMLVWLVQVFFSVWTVAYNFVPGGYYTREHSDWLLLSAMLFIGLALRTGARRDNDKSHTAFLELKKDKKMPTTGAKIVLALIVLAGVGGFVARYERQHFTSPAKVHPKADFSAAIWTYHFGYDNKGWPSLERSADLLKETGADVITLLESDASKPFLGNNDLGMWLAERLGMYLDFGPATKDHTWGNLILSKYPFVKSKHHLLPSPYGELAPAVTATVNMTGHLVDFVVTHMGNDRDVYDRELQAKVLATELSNAPNPVVFLGYVTSAPDSRDYKQLTQKGKVKDIDHTDKDRWCEYIMYRGLIRLGYARISHAGLSDTELQMARFRFPENPDSFQDNDKIVTSPKEVDADVHFSARFGSYSEGHNWVPKHHYHMSTPKYFVRRQTAEGSSQT